MGGDDLESILIGLDYFLSGLEDSLKPDSLNMSMAADFNSSVNSFFVDALGDKQFEGEIDKRNEGLYKRLYTLTSRYLKALDQEVAKTNKLTAEEKTQATISSFRKKFELYVLKQYGVDQIFLGTLTLNGNGTPEYVQQPGTDGNYSRLFEKALKGENGEDVKIWGIGDRRVHGNDPAKIFEGYQRGHQFHVYGILNSGKLYVRFEDLNPSPND